jgi:REP element-mobilizing transposase RayT
MDRYLDTTSVGPLYLRQPAIAQVVVNSLLRGVEEGHYELGAYAVMPNHVHTLLLPKVPPSQLMRALKGVTAREANRILNRTGQSFWQGESYDHWVRDQTEWDRIAKYIEENPVKAGLAVRAEAYPWSSAGGEAPCVGTSADAAGTSARATSHEKIT